MSDRHHTRLTQYFKSLTVLSNAECGKVVALGTSKRRGRGGPSFGSGPGKLRS